MPSTSNVPPVFGDEIGGHVMSGHIMTTAQITRLERSEFNRMVWFALPPELKPYILSKGFVGLDGCSLTIGDITETKFNVHLIRQRSRYDDARWKHLVV